MPFAGKYWKVLNEISDTKWVNERGYPANIYLFKIINRNTRNDVKYVQS